jgi:hypothetical protein
VDHRSRDAGAAARGGWTAEPGAIARGAKAIAPAPSAAAIVDTGEGGEAGGRNAEPPVEAHPTVTSDSAVMIDP